ncbi:MAG: efflux RND transporter permease subunit, partial [Candidatus Competibacterales bacterium]
MVDSTQMGLGLGARVDEGQTIITERVRAKMPEAAAYVHEGKFITANRAYLKLFGLRKLQDLQGMTLLGMVPRTDQAALKSAMTLALKFSQVVHLEVTGMTNLGSLAAMEMFIAPTRINGEPCHKVFARLREGPKLVPHDIDKTLGDASIAGFVNVEAKDEEEVIVDTVSQRPAFKGILAQILTNHVLANLTFAIVLLMGIMAYFAMPRERDPVVNFNFINVVTFWGGASAEEIAKRVTTVLEDAIGEVSDVRFVSSSSREGVSNILVRFDELDDNTFDKRVSDLRRAIQNHQGELPPDAETPSVVEYTSSNSFPNAILVLSGAADDEVLRRQGEQIKADLERIRGTERVELVGLHSPELQVLFDPDRLESIGVDPSALANSITSYYQDISAGALDVSGERWLVRLVGIDSDPDYLAQIPVVTAQGEVTLGSLANVQRGRENPEQLARLDDRPAILVGVFKRGGANSLTLIEDVKNYIERRNQLVAQTGVSLLLVNDQTRVTTEAIAMMQNNSLMGLLLVFIVATLFLGWQIAFFTCIGIPFTIAGTFWLLSLLGMTLNVVVLLGVILSIGMLVDDAVVVVESIIYRLQRGMDSLRACVDALQEVSAPVLASVLTTMAAFLPLMMLPGILGSFMEVVPLVVIVALAVSLVVGYWMLPSLVILANIFFDRPTAIT